MKDADPRIQIRLFGSPQVDLCGAPIRDLASDKFRALLAFLAANPTQPYRREVLAGLLWPESSERAARASLRNALAKLRRALHEQPDGALLDITYHTVAFRPCAACQLDLADFTAASQMHLDGAEQIAVVDGAVALYVGPFLDGFTLPGCAEFEEWMTVQREHYQRMFLEMSDRLTDAYARRGEVTQAIDALERQLQHAPWREESHRRLMEMLVRVGRRSEALEQFRRCERILAAELGVAPDDATVALYNAIRAKTGLPEAARSAPDAPRTA